MKDFLNKNKIILITSIYLILAGLFFYFLIIPLKGKINGKASEIQQEKIDQDITKKKIMTVPVIEKDYQKYKENEENLNVLMEPSQEVEFIKGLEALAEETNNKVEFKIQESAKDESKNKKTENADIKSKLAYNNFLSMQVALEGNYQSLINFIHKVENYKKYVNILSIRIEKISIDEGAKSSNKENEVKNEALNSILDIVVYIKK
ncbi:MAG TPA: hypothetical protein DIC35_02615 [Candidatus Moranbacteria bacterium]|nr:hypothetical protein [Candidatus Moranbacteria bacterium]